MIDQVRIRPERAADVERIDALTRLAFDGREVEVDMITRIRASADFIPELSLVAEAGDQLVGHCLLARKTLRGKVMPPVLQLGPLGVHPAWQRQGIGGRLVVEAQRLARLRGAEPLIVLVGIPAYYPRFGFTGAMTFGVGPDMPAAMAYPLVDEVPDYRGTSIPLG
ncbi:GNAT family N-acetyltransferase [Microlunatus parietis]|uniref:Putative N-acetyltransferase YhbS n=1 Tax=Microlunatus parietis TaxID=682979 RepID=A0A7Y9I709_9ACTN|nr:N-acetyltransferase [Microlunatus parietis]NYE71322.1 putative N-acetyltransferase YhbS [Microlunatus parietis]